MPSAYPYHRTIRNEVLGVSKVIRAQSWEDLAWLIDAQREKWEEQAERKLERQRKEEERQRKEHARLQAQQSVEAMKKRAEEETAAAKKAISDLEAILACGLRTRLRLDWDKLVNNTDFPAFSDSRKAPTFAEFCAERLGSAPQPKQASKPVFEERTFLQWCLPILNHRREERNEAAEAAYLDECKAMERQHRKELAEFNAKREALKPAFKNHLAAIKKEHDHRIAEHAAKAKAHAEAKARHNQGVANFKKGYESGSSSYVGKYLEMALARSSYPDPINGDPEVAFDSDSKTLVVNFDFPSLQSLPSVAEVKYVASRKELKPVGLKKKDREALFDSVCCQIALRCIHEAFTVDYSGHVHVVVFNGWVSGIDEKTGKPFTSCILSVSATRKVFLELDLSRVNPRECLRALKGLFAPSLVMLAPVNPILQLDREDSRFVEGRQILVEEGENLAAMDWEDFEHLVRELFEKEFAASGGEVKVTQASRDRGVDAIAFDPDPIRGGKFIIQAKRFNMAVPVSAVRDLYGTMIAEGATKGILVTTAHFGSDSREFAKDKPITLLDGRNLIHLFQKHGRNVSIALLPKGDPRRGV